MDRVFEEFVSYLRAEKGASPHTLRAYLGDLKRFFAHLSGGGEFSAKNFSKISRTDVRSYLAARPREGGKWGGGPGAGEPLARISHPRTKRGSPRSGPGARERDGRGPRPGDLGTFLRHGPAPFGAGRPRFGRRGPLLAPGPGPPRQGRQGPGRAFCGDNVLALAELPGRARRNRRPGPPSGWVRVFCKPPGQEALHAADRPDRFFTRPGRRTSGRDEPPRPAALLCHPPLGRRRRSEGHSGTPGALLLVYDPALYPCGPGAPRPGLRQGPPQGGVGPRAPN